MKVPYAMILDYVQTKLDAQALGDLLTMAGFELEGIEEADGDSVLDIKVVSNRGDGLSVLGLAREILAKDADSTPTELYERAAGRFAVAVDQLTSSGDGPSVTVETSDCTRYAGLRLRISSNGEAPSWVQSRLTQAGVRSISLLVDLTNYVMLEVGQPLHAFDLPKLAGEKIVVRHALAGETLTTLNGDEHKLLPGQLMICDAQGPVGAAGIMGGLATEVSEATADVLLESAHFAAVPVRKTRKALNLGTEASYRFERSVDPEGVVAALGRFWELLVEAQPTAQIVGLTDVYPQPIRRQAVEVRVNRARKLLALPIRDEEAQRILERLGMEVGGHGDPFYVVPPTWRPDIVREEDLIEELGRVYGYEKIPEELPIGRTTQGGVFGRLRALDTLRQTALRLGYTQVISHSLRSLHPLDSGSPEDRIGPRVPASPEHALLRDSVLPCLAETAQRNGGRNLSLSEVGAVFFRSGEQLVERLHLGLMATGDRLPEDRKGATSPQATFYSMKADVEALLTSLGIGASLRLPAIPVGRFHPTRQAEICLGDEVIGMFGQIHPEIADGLRLPAATFAAELNLDPILGSVSDAPKLRPVSRNPAVRRDISLEIDKKVAYESIQRAVTESAGDVLERQWLFDVYEGANIPAGRHSLGIALQLRKFGENFTDEEANQVRESVVAALVALGGTTR